MGRDVIAVTGATGFIGGHLVRRVAAQGAQVKALARSHADPLLDLGKLPIDWIHGDLLHSDSLRELTTGADCVVHAAADTRLTNRDSVIRTGVHASKALFQAASAAGVRTFVFLSTFDVYFGAMDRFADEATPVKPYDDLYGDSKIAAEQALEALAANSQTRLVILRLPAVLGPGSQRWCRDLVRSDGRPGTMFVPGDGNFPLPYLAVENLVDAILLSLNLEISGVFNVMDARKPYRKVADALASATGVTARRMPFGAVRVASAWAEAQLRMGRLAWSPLSAARIRLMTPAGARRPRASAAKFANATGWSRRVSFQDTIDVTAAWLRNTGRLGGPFAHASGVREFHSFY